MTRKQAVNTALEPLARALPEDLAVAVGRLIARHTYLDWVLGQVMYNLMEISIKQGRVIMKLPRPRVYIAAVRELLEFHRLAPKFNFDGLADKLEAADCARRELTRSIYMSDSDSGDVHLSRSPWDPGPGGDTQSESQALDERYLAQKRRDIEDAVAASENLRAITDKLLRNKHRNK
ncbi:MAG TPA: hypothetical protein VM051_14660 [Usitatibacter sp.]|nr:hypothetical protein [Usitatibacter sp.]